MSLSYMSETTDPTGNGVSCEPAEYVSLPVFLQRMGVSRRHGMEALCLTGLCWVENGRVRLQRHHEKAGLGRRLRNAEGYPFDLLSPEGVEYAQSRWPECLASVERWYRRDREGRIGRANDSIRRALPRGSTRQKVEFLRKGHPELTQREIAEVLGISPDTVKRCSAAIRKRSWADGSAASIKALGGGKLKSASPQDPDDENSSGVSGNTLVSPLRRFDPYYDPAEDIIHDTYPDGRPCVVDGVPFDFDSAIQEALARHAAKPMPPAPPRPPSPRHDHLRPTLFPVKEKATTEEAWHALETFRVSRHGNTCTAMEIAFHLDHFPRIPAKDTAEMVGVSVSTVRRHKAKRVALI